MRQDLARSSFQIVVVKNFLEPSIEKYLADVGAETILCTEQPGSLKVAAAFARCRGEIILLLDDDDLFEPSRLRTIAAAFESHPRLGFYGNQASYVGAEGQPLRPRSVPRLGNRPSFPKGTLLLDSPRTRADLRKLTYRYPEFNVGSSAIRRELVERSLPYLARMQMTVDTLLFYGALISEFSILLDAAHLTRYRIHGENTTLAGAGPVEIRLGRLVEFAGVAERDYRIVRELVASSGNAAVLRLIDARLGVSRLTLACRNPGSRRRDFVKPLISLIQYLDTYPVQESLPTILASWVFVLSPSAGRAAYRRQMGIG